MGSALEEDDESLKIKALRKLVLKDKDDKESKKLFKKTIKSLEDENILSLDKDGECTLIKKRKREEESPPKKKKSKKDKKEKKKKSKAKESESPKEKKVKVEVSEDDEKEESDTLPVVRTPLKTFTNPQGITRLFIGNLPFTVDETTLNEHLLGAMTHVKWITDKETGKFYGSAFVEIRSAAESSSIVNTLNGEELMYRPLKINYAPSRPGDVWPPVKGQHDKDKPRVKPMAEQPQGCVKLFIGNLSYEIDDDAISKFFSNVGAEMKSVRWLTHKDSGDFKGCGFIEFFNEEACAKAAELNGKHLLGRSIRIDWDSGSAY